ncbi:MAG: family 43 glycosylhydrolase [Spirochaetaceae bacterium]|jgi:hypothetical protein|nr:family 43 glycosylhydrolase [Spirochaetaceae bacterium]
MFRKTAIGIAIGFMLIALVGTSCSSPGGDNTVDTGNLVKINSVNVNIDQPHKGEAPKTTAAINGTGFSAGTVTWSPGLDAEDKFLGGTAYIAQVTLTAGTGFTFTGLADGNVKVNVTKTPVSVINNGSTLQLAYTFPATLQQDVKSLSITGQPSKLSYFFGETLDLTGIAVLITFQDDTTQPVQFAQMEDFGLQTVPNHGEPLNILHNGAKVRVYYLDKEALTNTLTVAIPDQENPSYPDGYPKTQEMANPLFWQFESKTVNWAGALQDTLGPLHTADGSTRVWNINGTDTLFVYASHDMLEAAGCDRMDRYHVFSTTDMKNWTDYGEIFNADDVPWHNGSFINGSKFMWAPDCVYKNGVYYYYFPHPTKNSGSGADSWGSNWQIGIAVSNHPASNFMILPNWLEGLNNGAQNQIDPHVFIDDDGTAYFYNGGGGRCYGGKLKDNMLEIDGDMQQMQGLDNFHEATWVHKYNGKYYLSYSDNGGGGQNNGDQLKYATSDNPLGPWEYQGVYVYATGNGTIHGSIVEFKNKWYAFYHSDYVSYVGNDQGRSVHVDELEYNPDGAIQLVKTFGKPYQDTARTVVNTDGDPDVVALSLKAVDFNEPPAGFNEIDGVNDGGRTYGYLSRHTKTGGTAVNTNYRKTVGMAIESSAGDYVLGELDAREFTRYTITAEKAGNYEVDVFVASSKTGGSFYLNTNGVNRIGTAPSASTVTVPNTNGVFTKVNVKNIPLVAGENVFDLRVVSGGFKVQKFEFRSNIMPLNLELVKGEGMDKKLKLTGVLSGPYSGTIKLINSSAYSAGFTPIRFEDLREGDEQLIDLPYYGGYLFDFQVTLDGSGRMLNFIASKGTSLNTPRFDTTFADKYAGEKGIATGTTPLIIAETEACLAEGPWDGINDLSLKGNAKWDDANLYLYLVVTDDVHYSSFSANNPEGIWTGDAIQVVVNMNKGAPGGGEVTSSNELGFALHTNGTILPQRWAAPTGLQTGSFRPTGWADFFKIERDETAKTTTYDLTIPWNSLKGTNAQAVDMKRVGISILLCDSDGASAVRCAFEYGIGINSPKAYGNITDLYLMDTGEYEELLSDSAEAAVSKAEGSHSKTDHDIAKNFAALVIDTAERDALLARLDALGL